MLNPVPRRSSQLNLPVCQPQSRDAGKRDVKVPGFTQIANKDTSSWFCSILRAIKYFPETLMLFPRVSLAWIWSSAYSPLNSCYWGNVFVLDRAWALIPQSKGLGLIPTKGWEHPWLALTTRIIPQAVVCPRNHVSAMQPGRWDTPNKSWDVVREKADTE